MKIVRNIKKAESWCWQEKKIMRIIREYYKGKKLTTATAIYQSLTEIASNNSSDEFPAYYRQIAQLCGKSTATVKNYCSDFYKMGILEIVHRKKDEKINLANQWKLLTYSPKDNLPTSPSNQYPSSVSNDSLHIEQNLIEENYKKRYEGDAYKALQNRVNSLRRGLK